MKGFACYNLLEDEAELAAANRFPEHFWTKAHGRGKGHGWGLDYGADYLVFKSVRNGKYLSMDTPEGNHMKANRAENGPWEKFKPHYSGDKVAFKAWNNKWLACHGGN